jgi:hypothetical protein
MAISDDLMRFSFLLGEPCPDEFVPGYLAVALQPPSRGLFTAIRLTVKRPLESCLQSVAVQLVDPSDREPAPRYPMMRP